MHWTVKDDCFVEVPGEEPDLIEKEQDCDSDEEEFDDEGEMHDLPKDFEWRKFANSMAVK